MNNGTDDQELALKLRGAAEELRKTAQQEPEKLDSQKVLDFLRFFGGYHAE